MLNSRIMEQYNTTGVLANTGSVVSFIWQDITIKYFLLCQLPKLYCCSDSMENKILQKLYSKSYHILGNFRLIFSSLHVKDKLTKKFLSFSIFSF